MKERSIIRVAAALIWCLALTGAIVGCGTSPPTVPEGLTVEATGDTEISVSWEKSTDYGELDGYRIYRNGKFYFKQNGTSFVDSGLMNGTEYCYRVSAYDKEGNRSEKSERECATTFDVPDTTAPSDLTGLAVVYNSSTLALDLSWDASTDAHGIAFYNIYRAIGSNNAADHINYDTSSTNSYADIDITTDGSTTYCYIVNAVDPAGNVSGPSNGNVGICSTPGS